LERHSQSTAGASTSAEEPIQPSLDLVMAEPTPPRPDHPRPRVETPPAESPPPIPLFPVVQEPDPPAPEAAQVVRLLEHLRRREFPALLASVRQALAEVSAQAAAQVTDLFSAEFASRTAALESRLTAASQEVEGLVKLMETVLDSAVETNDDTAKLHRETIKRATDTLEAVMVRAEKMLDTILVQANEVSSGMIKLAEETLAEARKERSRLGRRPWIMASTLCIVTIALITLFRPGWTMSAEQRRANRVGEAVIFSYSAASEAERTEMRRVMRWRSPDAPDSVQAPPIPSRR
jgi:hypothetical protein